MKLIFTGTGSAFTTGADNYQSNMLLVEGDQKLLVDCGSDIRHALWDLGLTYRDITNVYVSHLHGDHVGGLEWLAFTRHFDKACTKPTLFIPQVAAEDLWEKVLSGRYLLGERNGQTEYLFQSQAHQKQLPFHLGKDPLQYCPDGACDFGVYHYPELWADVYSQWL